MSDRRSNERVTGPTETFVLSWDEGERQWSVKDLQGLLTDSESLRPFPPDNQLRCFYIILQRFVSQPLDDGRNLFNPSTPELLKRTCDRSVLLTLKGLQRLFVLVCPHHRWQRASTASTSVPELSLTWMQQGAALIGD